MKKFLALLISLFLIPVCVFAQKPTFSVVTGEMEVSFIQLDTEREMLDINLDVEAIRGLVGVRFLYETHKDQTPDVVDRMESRIKYLLVGRAQNKQVWENIKTIYSEMIAQNDDWELAETFFNSITRRIFATVGVDAKIEFVNTDFDSPPNQSSAAVFDTYRGRDSTADLIEQIRNHRQKKRAKRGDFDPGESAD